jgi:hypothetical protein
VKGERNVTLTIPNDDPDEAPYVVKVKVNVSF